MEHEDRLRLMKLSDMLAVVLAILGQTHADTLTVALCMQGRWLLGQECGPS
jgi:hypothetical protein